MPRGREIDRYVCDMIMYECNVCLFSISGLLVDHPLTWNKRGTLALRLVIIGKMGIYLWSTSIHLEPLDISINRSLEVITICHQNTMKTDENSVSVQHYWGFHHQSNMNLSITSAWLMLWSSEKYQHQFILFNVIINKHHLITHVRVESQSLSQRARNTLN